MRPTWREVTLGEVCSLDKNKHDGSLLSFVGMENIGSGTGLLEGEIQIKAVKSSTFYFSENHVLYGRLRPYLNKVLVPKFEGHCSTEIFPLKVRGNIDRNFLAYWLLSEENVIRFNATSTGARMPRANVKEMLGFSFPLPPLDEQRQIVTLLEENFAVLDHARKNVETNLADAEGLSDSYIEHRFRKTLENHPLSELGEVCEFQNGKAHEKSIDEAGEYVVVNSKFISSEGKTRKYTGSQMSPLCIGDIAMVMSDVPNGRTLAKCYLVEEDGIYSLNQRICKITSKSMTPKFLIHQLNRHPHLLSFNNGENQTNLRKGDILATPLSVPVKSIQKEMVESAENFQSKALEIIALAKAQLTDIDNLRQSLLQHAFAGELS